MKITSDKTDTETIDKLFLELSQFTKAKTAREIELERNYQELIMAVGRKYHGETRHQTALRYIRRAEEAADAVGASMKPNNDSTDQQYV